MQTKRIIPCLDVAGGRVVKGVQFVDLRDAGDPVEIARAYDAEGADELAFLDITATTDGRDTMVDLVKRTAENINIPLTVGGGIKSVDEIKRLLDAGASKVSINTAAVNRPEFVKEAVETFGSSRILVAVDGCKNQNGNGWEVVTRGGQTKTGLDAIEWSKQMEQYGVGEILLTSMDRDGTKDGYDLELTKAVVDAVGIPVIASGGVGNLEHLYEGFAVAGASACLAASIFHFREYTISEAKAYLKERGVAVRTA